MPERLIPVYLGNPLEAVALAAGSDVPAITLNQASFAQVAIDAPYDRDPRQDDLGPLLIVLAGFEYKPRWRFVLTWGSTDDAGWMPPTWLIHVHTWVEDAYHPGKMMAGHSLAYLPTGTGMDEAGWLSFLRSYVIPRIEQHETDEWFRYKGDRIYDPHKPARSARGRAVATGGNGRGGAAGAGGGGGGYGGGSGGAVGSNGRAVGGNAGCGPGGGSSWTSSAGGCYP